MKIIIAIVAGFLSLLPATARAQDFPTRQITLVAPFPPGSTADTVARNMANYMSTALKVPVIVENKAGAGGILASREVLNRPSDGYTILVDGSAQAANPSLYKDLQYNPADLVPVAALATFSYVVMARPGLKLTKLSDLLDLAKTKSLSYAAGNPTGHVGPVMLVKGTEGIKPLTRVPYPGSAQAMTAVVADQVDFVVTDIPSAMPFIENKTLTPLAVLGNKRNPRLAEVPSVDELGMRYEMRGFTAMFVKADTPPKIVSFLHNVVAKALEDKEIKAFFERLGNEVSTMTQEEAQRLVKAQMATWVEVAKLAGVEKQ